MTFKPSIRNYAVIRRVEAHIWGSVWSVLDRRTGTSAFLYKPSPLVSWPRIFAALAEFDPFPLKLRNSRIIVMSQQLVGSKVRISKALWNPLYKSELDSTRGIRQVRSYRAVLVGSFVVLLSLVLFQPVATHTNEPKKQSNTNVCGTDFLNHSQFQLEHVFKIGRDEYKLVSTRSVGGYRVIKAKRACDNKTVNFSAWYAGDYLEISKVY